MHLKLKLYTAGMILIYMYVGMEKSVILNAETECV